MKRITPQAVVDAYIATGAYPCYGQFDDETGGLCALWAINRANRMGLDSHGQSDAIAAAFGVSSEYFWGFIRGFDSPGVEADESDDHRLGVEDGRAVREAVEAHFAKDNSPLQPQSQEIAHEADQSPVCC